jgi:hypothetical protein
MSVSYMQSAQKTAGCNDSFTSTLREVAEEFSASNINVFNAEDFKDVLAEDSLFGRYTELLATGLQDEDKEIFTQMAQNGRTEALEHALGTVAPMSFLQTPMLRKSWARLAMTKALPTEAVEKPKFTINYLHPWIKDLQGNKHYVPENLMDVDTAVSKVRLAEDVLFTFIDKCFSMNLLSGFDVDAYGADLTTRKYEKSSNLPAKYAEALKMVKPNDELDVNVSVISATFKTDAVDAGKTVIYNGAKVQLDTAAKLLDGTTPTAADLTKTVKIECATRTGAIKGVVSMDLEVDAACVGGTPSESAVITLVESIYGDVDVKTGRLTLMNVSDLLDSIKIKAYVSSVMNNATIQVGFDIRDKEIHIGPGEHLEAPVPNEYITDLLRMFSLNGVSRLVEILSNFLAQKMDLDGVNFVDEMVDEAIESAPQGMFTRAFSAKPVGNYQLNPAEWPKMLTKVLDHLSMSIINTYHYEQGYFVALCNPIDAALVPEISWVFKGNGGAEYAGVNANLSFGSYQGINSWKVVSSPNVPQGAIRVLFIPTVADQMTYKCYTYSFMLEQAGSGYNSPQNTYVPTILTSRRYAYVNVLPGAGRVTITNNSENFYSFAGTSSYLPTETFVH